MCCPVFSRFLGDVCVFRGTHPLLPRAGLSPEGSRNLGVRDGAGWGWGGGTGGCGLIFLFKAVFSL